VPSHPHARSHRTRAAAAAPSSARPALGRAHPRSTARAASDGPLLALMPLRAACSRPPHRTAAPAPPAAGRPSRAPSLGRPRAWASRLRPPSKPAEHLPPTPGPTPRAAPAPLRARAHASACRAASPPAPGRRSAAPRALVPALRWRPGSCGRRPGPICLRRSHRSPPAPARRGRKSGRSSLCRLRAVKGGRGNEHRLVEKEKEDARGNQRQTER
jgi:hypothetical protein